MGVDITQLKRFKFKNTIHYIKDIQSFLIEDISQYDLDETFAICSYVPDEEAKNIIKKVCKNIFMFYPSNKQNHVFFKKRK